jgi:hypothetical protein
MLGLTAQFSDHPHPNRQNFSALLASQVTDTYEWHQIRIFFVSTTARALQQHV